MLLHPLRKLRRAHQAGLHRYVGEARGGDGLLVAIRRRGETAEHGDNLDHEKAPSLRLLLAPLIAQSTGAVALCSLTGETGGKENPGKSLEHLSQDPTVRSLLFHLVNYCSHTRKGA